MSTQAGELQTALLSNANVKSRIIIQEAVASLTNGQHVQIADNVFSQNSTFLVERRVAVDDQGIPLDGRQPLEPVESFTLLIDNQNICHVRRDQTGEKVSLPETSCEPANNDSKQQ